MFGSQALTMVLEFFDHVEVDQCFICVQRLYEVVDGAFVYCRATLVTACLSCFGVWLSSSDSGIRVL